jgi:hypothetical protein
MGMARRIHQNTSVCWRRHLPLKKGDYPSAAVAAGYQPAALSPQKIGEAGAVSGHRSWHTKKAVSHQGNAIKLREKRAKYVF